MASSETASATTASSEDMASQSVVNKDEEVDKKSNASGGEEEPEEKKKEEESERSFECNICLDTASDAVISLCGHLFCWPCLHQWLETRPNRQICPVCKAGIAKDKVVPLYGRGNTDQKDPREKVPPRPRGQRPAPENTGPAASFFNPFGGGGGGGGANQGFHMSFGIGAFPFGIFATNMNMGGGEQRPAHGGAQPGTAQYEEEQMLHRVFLWVAFAFLFWLLIA